MNYKRRWQFEFTWIISHQKTYKFRCMIWDRGFHVTWWKSNRRGKKGRGMSSKSQETKIYKPIHFAIYAPTSLLIRSMQKGEFEIVTNYAKIFDHWITSRDNIDSYFEGCLNTISYCASRISMPHHTISPHYNTFISSRIKQAHLAYHNATNNWTVDTHWNTFWIWLI